MDNLDGSDVLSFTRSLMDTESESGSEGAVGAQLAQWLRSQGWEVTEQPVDSSRKTFNILATRSPWSPGEMGPGIILCSHMDTVPPHIPPRLSQDEKILYGRGSCDAKGVAAAQIFAVTELLEEDGGLDVGLLYLVEEETTHRGAIVANDLKLRPQSIICGEPTEMKLSSGQKGLLKFKLTAKGKSAHSGYPRMGESAIHCLLDVVEKIRREPWPRDPLLGETTVNVGLIKGGQAANALAASAEAVVAIRVATDPDPIFQRVSEFTEKTKVVADIMTCSSPSKLDTVGDFECAVGAFNTDLPFMKFESNPKEFLFGPGSITVAHGPDEFILVEDLRSGVQMYKKLIRNVAKTLERKE